MNTVQDVVSLAASGQIRIASHGAYAEGFRRLRKNKIAVISLIIFLLICLACIFAPFLTKWDYTFIDASEMRQPPSSEHILGTDSLGRDLYTRLLYGGRTTLKIALVSTALAAVFGGTIGIAAGYWGGSADLIIIELLDMMATLPVFILIIIVESILGWGRGYFMYALAIAATPQFARITRDTVMDVMGCEYIEASMALGSGHLSIIFHHVLHNIAPSLITRCASGVTDALLYCTIMGYLGIGINPPTPEWGALALIGKLYMRSNPHMMVITCAVIIICVLSVSLFSDGLRDALDPKE